MPKWYWLGCQLCNTQVPTEPDDEWPDEEWLQRYVIGEGWQRVIGGGWTHWFCPRHVLKAVATGAQPLTHRIVVRGLVDVVEVVQSAEA